MTYNAFGGTLNPTHPQSSTTYWLVDFTKVDLFYSLLLSIVSRKWIEVSEFIYRVNITPPVTFLTVMHADFCVKFCRTVEQ